MIPDAAWYYPDCKPGKAKDIENYVAFYQVRISPVGYATGTEDRKTHAALTPSRTRQNKVKVHE